MRYTTAILVVFFALLIPTVAQAEPSEWIGTHRLGLTEPVNVHAQNASARLIIQVPRKKAVRATCDLSYGMTVWNEGEYGHGTVTEFALNSCNVANGASCEGNTLTINALTPWSTLLQTTWLPPTGFVNEMNAQIDVGCYGTFSGTLLPGVGDGDWTDHPQDDIDHYMKFAGSKLTQASSGATFTITARTIFDGPPGEEFITAEKPETKERKACATHSVCNRRHSPGT